MSSKTPNSNSKSGRPRLLTFLSPPGQGVPRPSRTLRRVGVEILIEWNKYGCPGSIATQPSGQRDGGGERRVGEDLVPRVARSKASIASAVRLPTLRKKRAKGAGTQRSGMGESEAWATRLTHGDSAAASKMLATASGHSTWQSWPVFSSATSHPEALAFAANGAKNGLAGYSSATLATKVAGMLPFRLAGRWMCSSKQRRLKSHNLARTKSRAPPGLSPQRSSCPSPPGNRQSSPWSRATPRK